jgi:hypothetical protein
MAGASDTADKAQPNRMRDAALDRMIGGRST